MSSNETIFITGGAGFIGTNLSLLFLKKGYKVIVYDSFLRNAQKYFSDLTDHKNFTVIDGDVRNLGQLKECVKGADYVFHLAAIAGVSKYSRIPVDVLEVNVIGTYNILEAIKDEKNIKGFFDFSTSEIYGSNCFSAKEDGDVKMENLSEKRWTYATSKIASEKFGMSYFWQYEVPFIGIRPFNVYGPGQVGEGVLSYFINRALSGKELTVTGDGSQCRTFCYIDDFIHGIDILMNNIEKAVGDSFNIGCSDEIISMYSLAKKVVEIHGQPLDISFVEHSGEDVLCRAPSISKIKNLGYQPKVTLSEGVRNCYEWYRKYQVELD